jgi:hypothetical protein
MPRPAIAAVLITGEKNKTTDDHQCRQKQKTSSL